MKKFLLGLIEFVVVIIIGIAIGLGLFEGLQWAFELRAFRIHGISMFPALNHGDVCVVYNKLLGKDLVIQQGDIITFRKEHSLIKRVIGTPGDVVKIKNGLVFINEKVYSHPTILFKDITMGNTKITLGANEYFVLGDNRVDSRDSRTFGVVYRNEIEGKIWLRWRALTGL